ncbi:unnamed protein product [Brassicogethes aeneus]|uniref:AN1-type zinc finger protein 6 n=1 Tax=Brassicogethes aeneus TaxID=1431903 RepID=A0A9P0B7I2_BRAAE|nr:unnamed protein product [Brassicogethes aeneus]
MERESNCMQALCKSGCGFYGSPATDGLCSLCYKEALKKKQQLPTTPPSLSAYRETATAQPTISRLPTPVNDILSNEVPEECSALVPQTTGGSTEDVAAAAAAAADPDAGNDDKDSDKDAKKKKNRCATCRKKVGLTGFECRCGGLFCAVHRYSDKHDCSFNYREMGAQEIRRNNPVVVGEKIQKI